MKKDKHLVWNKTKDNKKMFLIKTKIWSFLNDMLNRNKSNIEKVRTTIKTIIDLNVIKPVSKSFDYKSDHAKFLGDSLSQLKEFFNIYFWE